MVGHYEDFWEKVRGGVIGHAVGDALGVPVEFVARKELAQQPVDSMEGYGTHNMPPGTWSDDTSMSICLLQSLIDCQRFDYDDIMLNFLKWRLDGEFTATGKTFDVGGTCSVALMDYQRGKLPMECGGSSVTSNGNGSLMRVLPVALVCYREGVDDPAKRLEITKNVSSLTHAHDISVMGCYIYVNIACSLLEGLTPRQAYERVKQVDYSMFSQEAQESYWRVLKAGDIGACTKNVIRSSGYVVHSLEAALWCLLNGENYRDTVLKAVNLGGDTDTIGAITGSLAGIYYGFEDIPAQWVGELRRSKNLLRLCDAFSETKIKV